jgi:putative DNA primase/helicase
MAVARAFVAQRYQHEDGFLLRHWRGQWWAWKTSHWAEIELRQVRAGVYGFTEHARYEDGDKAKPWSPNRFKVANVLEALGGIVLLSQNIDQPSWLDGDHGGVIVSCSNGLLDVPTRTLHAHTPRFFNQTSVPFGFDPEAARPLRWLCFLDDLWARDKGQIAALQEWFGYVLSGRLDLLRRLPGASSHCCSPRVGLAKRTPRLSLSCTRS